jgi:mono/diheme cytochrome c family protein
MIRRIPVVLLLLICLPLALRAQQASHGKLTDRQKEGRRIFQQRCAICHTPPTAVSKTFGLPLYKDIVDGREDSIRQTIREGSGVRMPGFRYGLDSSEIAAIIDFLKTRERPAPPKNKGASGK